MLSVSNIFWRRFDCCTWFSRIFRHELVLLIFVIKCLERLIKFSRDPSQHQCILPNISTWSRRLSRYQKIFFCTTWSLFNFEKCRYVLQKDTHFVGRIWYKYVIQLLMLIIEISILLQYVVDFASSYNNYQCLLYYLQQVFVHMEIFKPCNMILQGDFQLFS